MNKLKIFLLFFIIVCSPSGDTNQDVIEEVKQGDFNLPVYNGLCLYSEEEALTELERLREDANLDFNIKVIYQTGPMECAGRVWGSNLDQGAKVDKETKRVDLIVGKEDLNNLSREKDLPNEYGRTIDLGFIADSLFQDFSIYDDYITDIDYFSDIESYLYVGHKKSVIYISSKESPEPSPLIDLTNYVGTTESWETGLISIDPIRHEDNKMYFLAAYTDKDMNLSISVFVFDFSTGLIDKEKELFLSPQNGGEDTHYCGNIERIDSSSWVFCVGDQDTLYALNENSIRTDLYSGKLLMFSMNEDFEVYQSTTPSYNPEIFTPVGRDVRPKAVLASPAVKSQFEIEHILALGFRNPWGFAVGDGYIFVPDVGLNKVEEINLIDLYSQKPKFFGWPHKEGDFYYAKDEVGSFWEYEILPIYQHSTEKNRCANIGGAIHKSEKLPGWNGYFFFVDQCTYEIFIINKTGETVFRSISESIKSPPVVVKNDYLGNILISTYTGEILQLDLDSLNLAP